VRNGCAKRFVTNQPVGPTTPDKPRETGLMRLTLRTLLAWMDGLLPPGEAQELSVKVESSVAARHLAERIRVGMARGPLPAVDADPNTVAEYLDNCLAVDELLRFERSCLESDAQLAEVAGCHALLAEFIRGDVAGELRGTEPRTSTPDRAIFTAPPRPQLSADETEERWEPRVQPSDHRATERAVRPVAARPSAQSAWLSLLAAVVLLAILGSALAWSLLRSPSGRRAAGPTEIAAANVLPEQALIKPEQAVTKQAVPPVVPPPVPPPVPAAVVPEDAVPPPAPAQPALSVPTPPQVPVAAAVAPPPPVMPTDAAAEPRVPFGDALAIVAPSGGVVPAMPLGPQAADSAPVAPDPDMIAAGEPLVSDGPAMLRRIDADGGATWEAVPAGSALTLPANLMAPACGRPTITVDGLRLDVSPATQLTLTRDADDTPRLTIGFGAVVVSAARPAARLGVTAGDLCGVATLDPPGGVGIEVAIDREPGDDPEIAPAKRTARVIGIAAPLGWRQTAADGAAADRPLTGIALELVIPARAALEWNATDPAAAEVASPGSPPAWIAGGSDRLDRSAAEAVGIRLEAGDPVSVALHDLVAAGRVETRTAAAATLALVGDYEAAVRLLCGDLPGDALREEQWRALEAAVVPLALARGPRAAAALAEAFATHAPPGRGADLFRLARGLSDAELANGGAAELVAALDAPQVVVRRYAFKNLVEITAVTGVDRLRYRPDRPESLRREGVAWWQAQLSQDRIRRAIDAVPAPRP
jgi:hypothetical protein